MKENNEIEAIAYHEAAHAVFNIIFGFGVKKVTIIPENNLNGNCVPDKIPNICVGNITKSDYNWIRCILAGIIVQRKMDDLPMEYTENIIKESGDDGMECYEMLLKVKYNFDAIVEDPNINIKQIEKQVDCELKILFDEMKIEVENNWPEIESVAKELIKKKTLTGDEVKKIIKAQVLYQQ